MSNYPIEKCKNCKNYNHNQGKARNKLRCMIDCGAFRDMMTKRAVEYNMIVSNGDIPKFEMGYKVLGYKEVGS